MTGQDAVNVAEAFHETLELDGVILTKLDGDARGGAALSVKEVVQRPIAFASTGEKLDDFDVFYPDRLASRILGMGDVLTLIDKAKVAYDEAEAEQAANKLLGGRFTLEDFLEQMQKLKKMGPLQNLLGLMPGMPKEVRQAQIDDRQIGRVEAIIRSMTVAEREDPDLVDASRRNAYRPGLGHPAGRREGADRPVQAGVGHDEALRWLRLQEDEDVPQSGEEEGPPGRSDDAQGTGSAARGGPRRSGGSRHPRAGCGSRV